VSLNSLLRRLSRKHNSADQTSRDPRIEFLSTVPLLGWLDADDLGRLACMMRSRHVRAGTMIVSEGTHLDQIVVVRQGRVEAFAIEGDTRSPVELITAGGLIGLRSIIAHQPLPCEYVAQTDLELWEIPADTAVAQIGLLRQLECGCHQEKTALALLTNVPLFPMLESAQRVKLANMLHPMQMPSHCHVMVEGQNPSGFFLIVTGEIDVLARGAEGEDTVLNTLGPGDCFGDTALLMNVPVSATMRTRSAVDLLRLSPEDFSSIVGSLAASRLN
jgi:cAMP-dependent protein kinase regulator